MSKPRPLTAEERRVLEALTPEQVAGYGIEGLILAEKYWRKIVRDSVLGKYLDSVDREALLKSAHDEHDEEDPFWM